MHTQQDNSFGILMYHRVAPRVAGVSRPTWNVTPDRFRRQLAGLLSRGYRAWPLQRALACRLAGESIPARIFVVTFDDGYQSIYHNAWPILRELSIPATVFVVTSQLDGDGPFPSDDWSAAGSDAVTPSSWKPLSTAQCVEMLEQGLIEVGSHTHTHGDFRGRPDALRLDVARSLDVLDRVLGLDQASFAFPFGYYDPALIAAVREAGVTCALTTEHQLVSPGEDQFRWGRFMAAQYDTPMTLSLKLTGWYTTLRDGWRAVRRPWRTSRALLETNNAGSPPLATQAVARNKVVSP